MKRVIIVLSSRDFKHFKHFKHFNISNIQNVGVDAYLNDPGMVESSKPGGDDHRGIPIRSSVEMPPERFPLCWT
eukprot:3299778-Amphidinium_carterae.1